jgi:hypothetical protein
VVCSRVRELQEALFAATIALEISSRNARVAAFQKRWDRLRDGLDLVLDQRGFPPPRSRSRSAAAIPASRRSKTGGTTCAPAST